MWKKIVLVMICIVLTSFVYAQETLTIGDSWSGTTSMDDRYGVQCTAITDITITNIQLSPNSDCPACAVFNGSNDALLGNGSVSSGNCSVDIDLEAGQVVNIVEDPDYVNCAGSQNDATPNYPVIGTYINCTIGVVDTIPYGGGYSTNAGYIWAIATITAGEQEGEEQGTLTLFSNLVNTSNINENFNITWNGSTADTEETMFNCTLYNVTNEVYSAEVTIAELNNYWFDVTGLSDDYELWVECNNNGINDSTTKHFYEVDAILPELSFNTEFSNRSQWMKDTTLTIEYSWSDENFLYSNTTLFDTDGISVLDNDEFENASSGYDGVFEYLLDTSGYNFSIRFMGYDSHTKNNLLYDVIEKNESVIEYNNIKIYSDAILNYDQEIDKVSFTLDKEATIICYETQAKWKNIPESKYPNHWYDLENRVWVDDYYNDLELINDQLLCTEKIVSKEISSIGDLNVVTLTYLFDVISEDTILLGNIDDSIQEIYGVVNMLPEAFIYIAIMFLGVLLIINGKFWAGLLTYVISFGFDWLFVGYFQDKYSLLANTTSFYGSAISNFSIVLMVWILLKIAVLFFLVDTKG